MSENMEFGGNEQGMQKEKRIVAGDIVKMPDDHVGVLDRYDGQSGDAIVNYTNEAGELTRITIPYNEFAGLNGLPERPVYNEAEEQEKIRAMAENIERTSGRHMMRNMVRSHGEHVADTNNELMSVLDSGDVLKGSEVYRKEYEELVIAYNQGLRKLIDKIKLEDAYSAVPAQKNSESI